jgi:hypothetical protein
VDRTPKFPIKQMALATRGARNRLEQHLEAAWRERIMGYNREQLQDQIRDHQTRTDH